MSKLASSPDLPPEIIGLILNQVVDPKDVLSFLRVFPHLAASLSYSQIHSLDDNDETILHHLARQDGDSDLLAAVLANPSTDPNFHYRGPRSREHSSKCNLANAPLHIAINNGNLAAVQVLLAHPFILPNHLDNNDLTPLETACYSGETAIVSALLEHDSRHPNPNFSLYAPLYLAAINGHVAVIELLLAHSDPIKHSKDVAWALQGAAGSGQVAVIEMLLRRPGIDFTGTNILVRPLESAAAAGQEETVRLLLQQEGIRADGLRNGDETTPLWYAARHGQTGILSLLLERNGVDVNAREQAGLGVLGTAAMFGHHEAVRLLLQRKDVDVNARDNQGKSALDRAMERGEYSKMDNYDVMIKLLLEHGGVAYVYGKPK